MNKYKAKVRYIDIDLQFAGHQYCEPGAEYKDPLKQILTSTWSIRNLNYEWQVAGKGSVIAQEAKDAFNGQPVTAWSVPSGWEPGGNNPENGWRLRSLHMRYIGYTDGCTPISTTIILAACATSHMKTINTFSN